MCMPQPTWGDQRTTCGTQWSSSGQQACWQGPLPTGQSRQSTFHLFLNADPSALLLCCALSDSASVPRLISNDLCSHGWSWAPDSLVSTSQVLGLQVCQYTFKKQGIILLVFSRFLLLSSPYYDKMSHTEWRDWSYTVSKHRATIKKWASMLRLKFLGQSVFSQWCQ